MENTVESLLQGLATGDHLHIRGEYVENVEVHSLQIGSPPHTWRIQFEAELYEQVDRITSTYVENTFNAIRYGEMSQDHLHIRGEYDRLHIIDQAHTGSPPHTWRILISVQ